MTNLPPNVSEIANWIIYMNIGAVLFLAVGSPILIALIKRWITALVSQEFCQMNQAKCRENMTKTLADKFAAIGDTSRLEHGMIYREIKENREGAVTEFGALRKDINEGLLGLTNLLISHIQKNGG